MKHVALVANGAIEQDATISPLIKEADQVIAVDGGLCHLNRMGISPDLIIGDFDSVPTDVLEKYPDVPKKSYPRDKDETDLELALQLCDQNVEKISIFGALKQRTDHALYNLHLLRRYPQKAYIETEWETIFAINSCEIPVKEGQTLSFLPLGEAVGIRSVGLKWELNDQNLSISNIATDNTVKIKIEKGDLLCFLLKL